MAQIELERAAPPAGAEAEYAAASSARDALQAQQNSVAHSRGAVRPANRAHAVRLAIGYLTVFLLLVAVGKAIQPSGAPAELAGPIDGNGTEAPERPGDDSPGDGGGSAPFVPSVPTPGAPIPGAPAAPCFACNSSGQTNCVFCFGAGTQTCFQCNGAGTVPNQANNFLRLPCSLCNRTGKQDCPNCQYGKVLCAQCNGTGHR